MNEEDILKDDPLKKPKKITVALVVFLTALLMVCAFASFHWICADYFNYKANESDAHKQLDEMRARYAEEESASKERLFAIEKEFAEKRAEKLAEHKRYSDELDEAFQKKKDDIAALLRGYIERFVTKTNDFELAIAGKNAELVEIKRMISVLPDVRTQLVSECEALKRARDQRNDALEAERKVQETYGKWSAMLEMAKAQLNELNGHKDVVANELDDLSHETNAVHLTLASLREQCKTLEAEIETKRINVKAATEQLKGVQDQIEVEETRRKTAEDARTNAETALNVALDKKREAESARDKALSEAQQAESHLAKRKPEIEDQINYMERILETKSKAVKAADDKREGGTN